MMQVLLPIKAQFIFLFYGLITVLYYDSIYTIVVKCASSWYEKNGGINKNIKVGLIFEKYDILTVQEKYQAHRGNKTSKGFEMTPWKIDIESWRLKESKMGIKKITQK